MKLGYFLEKKLKKQLISVTFPCQINVRFSQLYGLEKEKEVLQDIVNYFSKDSFTPVMPHTSYYIAGPLGVGKASLIYALAKEAKIPVVSFDSHIFRSGNNKDIAQKFKLIFDTARMLRDHFRGCIIAFKNIHEINFMDDDAVFYSNLLRNLFNMKDIFMFMLSISPLAMPAEIVEKDLFTTEMSISYPNLADREKIFKSCIKKQKVNLAPNVSINRLAKDTLGETPLSIAYIVKEAQLYSLRHKHSKVTQSDFSETIMRFISGEKTQRMTEKERIATAYHEAGHVVAGYFSDDEYTLSRVEICPRIDSLGLTVSDFDETKFSYFKKDFENLIIHYLGGLCAEEEMYDGSHTSGVSTDLAYANAYAAKMVVTYGMSDALGSMVVIKDLTDSPYTREIVDKEVKNIMNTLTAQTREIIKSHRHHLEALAKALIENEVVNGTEIKKIFEDVDKKLEKET